MLSSEVLPAPFGPMMERMRPLGTSSDTSSTARLAVRLCDSLVVQVSRDTSAEEGKPVKLWGKADCADRVEWSVVSGPAPRLTDPGVDTLAFPAPRVTRDTAIRYRFTAYSGGEQRSLPVVLRVLEAVPDPDFTLAAELAWNGAAPLVLRPTLLNKARLDLVKGYPLRYLWSLDPDAADTAVAGDSLVLRNPAADGILVASQPNGAPTWYPCNDRPADKARYRIELTLEAGYTVAATGHLDSQVQSSGRVTWIFVDDLPTASYLVALHIGRYRTEALRLGGMPGTVYYPAELRSRRWPAAPSSGADASRSSAVARR